MADGPLTATERAATEHLAAALGMTQAQAIGVIALTEQNTVLFAGGRPPCTPGMEGLYPSMASPREDAAEDTATPALWLGLEPCGCCRQALRSPPRLALWLRLRPRGCCRRRCTARRAWRVLGNWNTNPFGLIFFLLICRTSCSSLVAAAGADKGWLPRRGC
jgi:hypothetical protein